MKRRLLTLKKNSLSVVLLTTLLFLINSCKKDIVISSNNKRVESLRPEVGNPFLDTLFEKVLSYNLKSPVLDTVAEMGKIKWKKQLLKISSKSSSVLTLIYPIVQNDSLCKNVLEIDFTSINDIRSIRIIRSVQGGNQDQKKITTNSKNRLFYAFYKGGVKIPDEIVKTISAVDVPPKGKSNSVTKVQSADPDCEYIINWDLYINYSFSTSQIQTYSELAYYFELFTRQYLDNLADPQNPDFSSYQLSFNDGTFIANHNSEAYPLGLLLGNAFQDAAIRMQYVNQYSNVSISSYAWNGISTCGSGTIGGGGGSGGGGEGGTGGGNTGGGSGMNAREPDVFQFVTSSSINLENYFSCFNNLSNSGALYYIELRADLPVNSDPSYLVNPNTFPPHCGHAFITLTKITGNVSKSQSFGFYPSISVLSLTAGAVGSMINDDGGHEFDASIIKSLSAGDFQNVMDLAKYQAGHMSYDINDYNCTDYAMEVFNSAPGANISIANWIGTTTSINYGRTPNGLYNMLAQRKSYGDQNIQLFTGNAPGKEGPCN